MDLTLKKNPLVNGSAAGRLISQGRKLVQSQSLFCKVFVREVYVCVCFNFNVR